MTVSIRGREYLRRGLAVTYGGVEACDAVDAGEPGKRLCEVLGMEKRSFNCWLTRPKASACGLHATGRQNR